MTEPISRGSGAKDGPQAAEDAASSEYTMLTALGTIERW